MSEAKKFAESLLAWLTEELRLVLPNDSNSAAKYVEICQTNVLRKMWKFVMKHVRSEETVVNMIGNLEVMHCLKKLKDVEELRDRHKSQLAQEKAEIEQLESALKQNKQSACQSELAVFELQVDQRKQSHQSTLHKAHAVKVENVSSAISNAHLHIMTEQKQQQVKMSQRQNQELGNGGCTADVSRIQTFLKEHFETSLQEQTVDLRSCEVLWKKIVDLTNTYPADFIVNALKTMVKEEKEKVLNCEKEINSEKEILSIEQALRADDTDISDTEQNRAKLLGRIIQKQNLENLNELMHATQCNEQAQKLQLKANQIKKNVECLLYQQLHDDDLQLALSILDHELELASSKAALEAIVEVSENIQKDLEKKEKMQKHREAVLNEVKNFNKELAENRRRLVLISKQNAEFQSHLMRQQAESLASVQALFRGKPEELFSVASSLPSTLKSTRKAFHNADLLSLMSLPIKSKHQPVNDFLIHRPLKMTHASGGQVYQRIAATLGTHFVKDPTDFLREIRFKQDRCYLQQSCADAVNRVAEKSLEMRCQLHDLNEEVRIFDAKQNTEFLPHVKRAQKLAAGVRKEEEKLRVALSEWYEEPAQEQAPWLTANGLTLTQTKQQF